jgi:Secretion system C-terminal sorting domain
MDGSGGYFWATDTSFIVSSLSSALTIVRSERNGIFVFGYGTCNSNPPTAIGSSVMIVAQSSLPQDPIAQEHAVAWYANINGPASSFTNTFVPISGTAFIDQGPLGSWMDFYAYSLYYRAVGDTIWHAIVIDSTQEIRHATLANWNTIGLTQGNYELKLTLISNLGDSVDAQKGIILQPGILGVNTFDKNEMFNIYPNPTNDLITIDINNLKKGNYNVVITDKLGRIIKNGDEMIDNRIMINTSYFKDGIYSLIISNHDGIYSKKFAVYHKE